MLTPDEVVRLEKMIDDGLPRPDYQLRPVSARRKTTNSCRSERHQVADSGALRVNRAPARREGRGP